MEIQLSDPHPGRCLNYRKGQRCLDYDKHDSVCVFPDSLPPLEAGSWGWQTVPKSELWVSPL